MISSIWVLCRNDPTGYSHFSGRATRGQLLSARRCVNTISAVSLTDPPGGLEPISNVRTQAAHPALRSKLDGATAALQRLGLEPNAGRRHEPRSQRCPCPVRTCWRLLSMPSTLRSPTDAPAMSPSKRRHRRPFGGIPQRAQAFFPRAWRCAARRGALSRAIDEEASEMRSERRQRTFIPGTTTPIFLPILRPGRAVPRNSVSRAGLTQSSRMIQRRCGRSSSPPGPRRS
jgi:hypothetical protein